MLLLYRVGKILGVDVFGVFGLGDDFLYRGQGVIVGRQPAQVIGTASVVAPTGCRITPGVLGVRDSSAPRTSAKVITWARPSPLAGRSAASLATAWALSTPSNSAVVSSPLWLVSS